MHLNLVLRHKLLCRLSRSRPQDSQSFDIDDTAGEMQDIDLHIISGKNVPIVAVFVDLSKSRWNVEIALENLLVAGVCQETR